ncbi:hypothetical protein Cob_v010196 [Colletotrichum orbiculare MAFF 240422]|uniref:Uncharacterized protein n=1 Tax=Colletotrichum orbiculare (strain 104-T / ATCC 96160 / CBS 514.97 / LARS 414 / MAFF 240422) TaxID=1213857 RepID=A0A484FF60_COLOR|nr:hypothetical protein Cob_v010196 [Colletotrichum orbiculare MAFF 240422]
MTFKPFQFKRHVSLQSLQRRGLQSPTFYLYPYLSCTSQPTQLKQKTIHTARRKICGWLGYCRGCGSNGVLKWQQWRVTFSVQRMAPNAFGLTLWGSIPAHGSFDSFVSRHHHSGINDEADSQYLVASGHYVSVGPSSVNAPSGRA